MWVEVGTKELPRPFSSARGRAKVYVRRIATTVAGRLAISIRSGSHASLIGLVQPCRLQPEFKQLFITASICCFAGICGFGCWRCSSMWSSTGVITR